MRWSRITVEAAVATCGVVMVEAVPEGADCSILSEPTHLTGAAAAR